jgi:hypothetical protein
MAQLPTVASLWIGTELSWLEQVCLKSFVDHGHEVVLFSYAPVDGVPDGVVTKDAAEILPSETIIRHERTGSPAYHADLFRLRLMTQTEYVWIDTDAYCHAPLRVPGHGHYHGLLGAKGGKINNGVLRLPVESATLKAMLAFTSDEYPIPPWASDREKEDLAQHKAAGNPVHVSKMPWGVWGPTALTHFLNVTGEAEYSQPQEVLYPVPFEFRGLFFRPGKIAQVREMLTENTVSVHLWGRRFRRMALKWGGVPPVGSYADRILAAHKIDPAKTMHLMDGSDNRIDAKAVSFEALGDADLVNVCLQRSSVVGDGSMIAAWSAGDSAPLMEFVSQEGASIAARAWSEIRAAFDVMAPSLDKLEPGRIVDIGCGYAFFDLMMYRAYDCDIVLIDIEDSEVRHFGFQDEGAGYASLDVARKFLTDNGVPNERIITINPKTDDLSAVGEVDLVVSMISCGFHYAAQTYDALYRENVVSGGAIILDIRTGSRGVRYLKELGDVTVLAKEKKYATCLVEKA